MRAVTWQGRQDVQVTDVPDAAIEQPTDAVVRITSTALCGSDLHLYDPLAPFMTPGDVIGHEPMGVVEAVGAEVSDLAVGDRVVVPFNISCGTCWMCSRGLHSQCETTQNRDQGTGASLFGFSSLYGAVPGGQAEALRVPFADTLPIRVPDGPPDERFLFLSDVLPTAWQGVQYADVPEGGTLLVMGAGPIGDMAARIALTRGLRVIVVDLVPERLARVRARGAETIDLTEVDADDLGDVVRGMTDGRGADAVHEAVGLERTARRPPSSRRRPWACCPSGCSSPSCATSRSTGWPRSTSRSTACAAAARSRSPACTAGPPTRCRCSSCSTSRCSCAWARPTSAAGATTSSAS